MGFVHSAVITKMAGMNHAKCFHFFCFFCTGHNKVLQQVSFCTCICSTGAFHSIWLALVSLILQLSPSSSNSGKMLNGLHSRSTFLASPLIWSTTLKHTHTPSRREQFGVQYQDTLTHTLLGSGVEQPTLWLVDNRSAPWASPCFSLCWWALQVSSYGASDTEPLAQFEIYFKPPLLSFSLHTPRAVSLISSNKWARNF